jgi:tetratricopeptide (TPR) repeat protein
MTNDELLAKMLDGTITPTEKSLLTSEALKNATLAQAIEQLQRVEALLAQSPHSYSAATDEFLKSIEDEIAEKVRDNRRKPVPILPPYIDTKWNWNILLYSVSAILTVGAAGYFGYTAFTTPTKKAIENPQAIAHNQSPQQPIGSPQSSQPTAVPPQPTSGRVIPSNSYRNIESGTPQQTLGLEHNSLLKPESNPSTNQAPVSTLPTKSSENTPPDNGELDGIASSGSNKDQQMINTLSAQLAEKRASGDKFSEMTLNKQIGMLYGKRGKRDEALRYLETALTHSRAVNAKSQEGAILGEIGLLESKHGNKDLAAAKIQQAIDILAKNGLNHDKWTRELSNLSK